MCPLEGTHPGTPAIRRGFADIAEGQVHYREAGRAQSAALPLVMLHASPGSAKLLEPLMRPLAARLHDEAGSRVVIMKLGDRGILTCRSSHHVEPRSFFVVDSFAERVVDAVGAGDALLAYATLCMVGDGSEVVASILGSLAAAVECERDGNIPIGKADVLRKIEVLERLVKLGSE